MSSASNEQQIQAWWTDHRHLVRDVAYRVLGSIADAEDVVQDAYLRLLGQDPATIENPRGWLVTVASRLAIDRLRAHEHSRREYIGPWLPEPILPDEGLSPEDRVTLDDSVRMALLVTLERLSPAERTAFILHDVFDLDFASIADILGTSSDRSRQLASRARKRVQNDGHARFSVDPVEARRLTERFARACSEGDLDGLIAVLAPDVHGDFDHGGLIPGAPTTELVGAEPVARQLLGGLAGATFDFLVTEVNGEPGVIASRGGRILFVLSFDIDATGIAAIRGIGNPQKLRHLAGLATMSGDEPTIPRPTRSASSRGREQASTEHRFGTVWRNDKVL